MDISTPVQKHIWITGASSGIGRAIAENLGAQGHCVYISSRSVDKLEAIAEAATGDLIPIPCDVTDDDTMESVLQDYGIEYLDTIILCAGTVEYIDLPELDIDKIRKVMDTNLFGLVNACRAALPVMEKAAGMPGRGRPHIIGISSMSTYVGFTRAQAYGTSKAAVSYFLDSLRVDLKKSIDVTVVYPGFIRTPMTATNDFPMPFLMEVEDAAEVLWKKAQRRPRSLQFPTRLHLVLKIMQLLPMLWYSLIGPRLSRQARQGSKST